MSDEEVTREKITSAMEQDVDTTSMATVLQGEGGNMTSASAQHMAIDPESSTMEPNPYIMSMFASVWVKVEVADECPETSCDQIAVPTADVNPFEQPEQPKRKRRYSKILRCDLCNYTTVWKNCLEIHMIGHSSEKPHRCELCPYATKYASSLYRHMTIKHYDKFMELSAQSNKPLDLLKCDHCDYTTYFKWNLNGHKRKHKLEKQFKCTLCSYETAYRHNFMKHSKSHKGGNVFKCDKCPFVTKYEGHIQRHLAKIHSEVTEKAHMCDLCDFSTKEKWRLTVHKQRSKKNNIIKCAYCDFETEYTCHSKKHKTVHYNELYGNGKLNQSLTDETAAETNTFKTFTCDLCDFVTQEKYRLTAHKHKSKQDNLLKCVHCGFETRYVCHIKQHKMIQHSEIYGNDKPNYSVSDETKTTENNAIEIFNENGEKAYMCDLCEFAAKEQFQVSVHKQRSKQDDLLKCVHCEFETEYMCQMRRHKTNNHSEIYGNSIPDQIEPKAPIEIVNEHGEKAFMCDLCDYTTKEKSRMTAHHQRSRQDCLVKCEYCNYETEYTCEIKKHKMSHFNELYDNGKPNDSLNDEFEQIPTETETETFIGHILNNERSGKKMERNSEKHAVSNNYTLDSDHVDWHSIDVLESSDKERPFQCPMCSYTSKFKASVQRHFQRHHTGTKNRPYKCSNCDFSTKTKDQIALHNKRSQSDALMNCSVCPFTTYFKCKYIMHQKYHYTHKCTLCSYSCKHKYDLTKHFAMHLGIGMKCQYCDFRAARKESLLCHETIHTGVKPFKCELCDYSSVRKSLLDNHLKRYHSDLKKDITIVSQSKIQSLKTSFEELEEEVRNKCQEANAIDVMEKLVDMQQVLLSEKKL